MGYLLNILLPPECVGLLSKILIQSTLEIIKENWGYISSLVTISCKSFPSYIREDSLYTLLDQFLINTYFPIHTILGKRLHFNGGNHRTSLIFL